jgi:L-ascorbate metabolism protein UlaG (beta-lactamase superfamily)
MKKLFLATLFAFTVGGSAHAMEPKLRWLGHAAFQYTSREGKIFLIDPWISNPKAPKDISFKHVEGILITHGHFDHVGEAFDLAKKFNAPIVCSMELANIANKHGIKNVLHIYPSGTQHIGNLSITAVEAVHASSYKEGDNDLYAGAPMGFVITEPGAATFYHAGDTGVFSDMALIAALYSPQVVLLPIGGVYTMGPAEAANAARSLQARSVIPMHYGTFPALTGTPQELALEMKRLGVLSKVVVFTPGQEMTLKELASVK